MSMKLRTQILLLLFLFALAPLVAAVFINVPLVFGSLEFFYRKAYLQNLREDFRDLDQYLATRHEMARLLAKLPEPGMLFGEATDSGDGSIDLARARYTEWINRILYDQPDIVEIAFIDRDGRQRFWLDRDPSSLELLPTLEPPQLPSSVFIESALHMQPGGVNTSPIIFSPLRDAAQPSRYMILRIISPVVGAVPTDADPKGVIRTVGAVVLTIDVGGLVRAYPNTFWVLDDGSYLRYAVPRGEAGEAFNDFPGLSELFDKHDIALWQGKDRRQVFWVPLFVTEQSGPLWVGRSVDRSPIVGFSQALQIRVGLIVLVLVIIVLLVARRFALRAERFGRELTEGIGRVLRSDEKVQFGWRGPEELQTLARNLTRLAETHARNNQALRAHARELELSNRYKSEFLANVSHELRTPLNSILLLSKMLATEEGSRLTQEQTKQARIIHAAGKDLKSLIDNILDLSRIEAGQAVLNLAQLDLTGLLEDLIELVRPQFEEKGLALDLVVAEDAVRMLISDEDKLRQIIKNFLSNAVKFTETGRVVVTLAPNTGEDARTRPVRISVSDTGIGIAADKQQVIFEAFKQADGSTSRRYGGTGLGLTISRDLAHILGGRIELQSSPNEGAVFSLLLPLEADMDSLAQQMDDAALREKPGVSEGGEVDPLLEGRRILIVDDEVADLLALTSLLEGWGVHIFGAGGGEEALDTLGDESGIDAALVDIMMPEMNGYETIKKIRHIDGYGELPVIALTPRSDSEARQQCLAAGSDECLTKPVEPGRLKAILTKVLGPRDSGERENT